MELPHAERDHRRGSKRDEERRQEGQALHVSESRPSRAALRYSSASSTPLATRRPPITIAAVTGIQISNWSHSGGSMLSRSEEHTSELQSLMRISYAVFCLKKKNRMT